MAFKSDRQRKAVMAQLNKGQSKAPSKPSIIGRIKAKEMEILEKLRKRREKKGKERIAKELEALRKEKITAQRLRAELEVEQAREAVAVQRAETQAKFKKIERARRERKLAPIRAKIKRAIETGKGTIKAGKKVSKKLS